MKNIIVMVALMAFAPALSLAQQTFGNSSPWGDDSNDEIDKGETGVSITNQGFGENPEPLGSGIAILVASAAGYTILKKRNNNKSTESINN